MDFEQIAKSIQESIQRDEEFLSLVLSGIDEWNQQMIEGKIQLEKLEIHKSDAESRLLKNRQKLNNLETYILGPRQIEAIENEQDDLLKWYRENKITNIRSCDTSNPVIAGLYEQIYIKGIGLRYKNSTKLVDLIDTPYNETNLSDILFNIKCFRSICNDW